MTYSSFFVKSWSNSEANLNNAGCVHEVPVSIQQPKLIPAHGPASQRIALISISGTGPSPPKDQTDLQKRCIFSNQWGNADFAAEVLTSQRQPLPARLATGTASRWFALGPPKGKVTVWLVVTVKESSLPNDAEAGCREIWTLPFLISLRCFHSSAYLLHELP